MRLAITEKLFVHPYYSSLLIDQSVAMNRRRDDASHTRSDDEPKRRHNQEKDKDQDQDQDQDQEKYESIDRQPFTENGVSDEDKVPRIYVCATMWHEGHNEMVTFLKSIFYLDRDYAARRNARHMAINSKASRAISFSTLKLRSCII